MGPNGNPNGEYIEIAGTVDSVIYQNEENGYTVLRVETQDGGQITAVGCLPFSAPGERMLLEGEWMSHPRHGEQFKVGRAQRSMPVGADAIYEYLSSRVVKGIGPATALMIVSEFGDRSLDVLEREPEKLAALRGISHKKAVEISDNFKKQAGLRRLIEFLHAHSLLPQLAMRLYRFYGEEALAFVNDNPYILAAERIGAEFAQADALALSLGFEDDCPQRVEAAICFELSHNAGNGHCFIPRDKLIDATAQLIGAEPETVNEGLDALIDSGEVVADVIAGLTGCYLRSLFEAETSAVSKLSDMTEQSALSPADVDALIDRVGDEQGISYADFQREAIRLAARSRLLVITGGPGTGKTTCVRAITALFERMKLETVLAAPTGRAAKRMSELTGREAYTVHRLLEACYSRELDETVFRRGASDPLDCGAIVLDECSMVDITLFAALLDALPADCRLVMVGDADQLPSVGPGNVFSDVIRAGCADIVRLTEIFRQDEQSRIVTSAHMINRGEYPDLQKNDGGFFFLRRIDALRAVDTVVELCAKRLPENMGIPARDIQVLTPSRLRETGTASLNLRLQEALNPPAEGKKERKFGEITFREGDRVMQIRNNYDIIWKKDGSGESGTGIFNGDIGHISRIGDDGGTVYVDFDDRTAAYTPELLLELEHAFAMTVHKSQGSEYRAVVLLASKGPSRLLTRGVLYTAVTRARELLVIVGDDGVFGAMIDNDRQTRRYSGLKARLMELRGEQ